jgi:predicted DNA-binding protein
MRAKNEKSYTVRLPLELAKRLNYIADYYGRTVAGQISWLAKQEIEAFEKEHGEIELNKLED